MDNSSTIYTGSGGVARLFTKRNFIIAGILLGVGLLAWGTIGFINRPRASITVQAALLSSSDAFAKGDYTGALAALQGVTSQHMTQRQKVEVYGAMASAAVSGGKLQEALQYYAQKHQADPGTAAQDAYSMATVYERLGNSQEAIKQYKIAIDYYKSKQNTYNNSNNDLPSLEARLQALETQQ